MPTELSSKILGLSPPDSNTYRSEFHILAGLFSPYSNPQPAAITPASLGVEARGGWGQMAAHNSFATVMQTAKPRAHLIQQGPPYCLQKNAQSISAALALLLVCRTTIVSSVSAQEA